MRSLLNAVNWESDMFDLSVNDCWNYFETFDKTIELVYIPLTRLKKCKNINFVTEFAKRVFHTHPVYQI